MAGAPLEVSLSFGRGRWSACSPRFELVADELTELDAAIAGEVRATARPGLGGPVLVDVRFDVSSLPSWLRQYQAHYFNYRLVVDVAGSSA